MWKCYSGLSVLRDIYYILYIYTMYNVEMLQWSVCFT